jgi:MATE family multidrug resistance protein
MNRQILWLAVPNVIASLSDPLVGIVDTALVGHLPVVAYMGAVAVGSVLFEMMFWGFGFLRMGTTSLTAQYYGAGRHRSCAALLYQTALMACAIGLVLILAQDLIAELGFRLAGGTEEVSLWGRRYFEIRIYAAPIVLVNLVLIGFFRGIADAITPMWMTIVINVVNVVADYVLIYGKFGAPALGVLGAAWASVLAVACGLVFGLAVLVHRYRVYLIARPDSLFDRGRLGRLVTTNFNLFGRTACLLYARFLMLALAARMGEVPLAANAVAWQIWSLVSYVVDGLAFATETLVGNTIGARDYARARSIARRCIWSGVGLGACFGLAYWIGMAPIADGFTEHVDVSRMVVSLTLLIAAIQPLNGAVFILDGVFIGANDTGYLFRAMVLAAFAVYTPAILMAVNVLDLGLYGVWAGYNFLMVGRFAVLFYRYRGERWLRTFLRDGEGG